MGKWNSRSKRRDTRSDLDREKDASHVLRSEVRRLRKEVQHLRKQLSKYESREEQIQELIDDLSPEQPVSDAPKCPKCHQDAVTAKLGKFNLVRCTQCQWRQRRAA